MNPLSAEVIRLPSQGAGKRVNLVLKMLIVGVMATASAGANALEPTFSCQGIHCHVCTDTTTEEDWTYTWGDNGINQIVILNPMQPWIAQYACTVGDGSRGDYRFDEIPESVRPDSRRCSTSSLQRDDQDIG